MSDRTALGLVSLALVATSAYVLYRLLEHGHPIDVNVTVNGVQAEGVPISMN